MAKRQRTSDGAASSGEEDEAAAVATGSAFARARAVQRNALVADLRVQLSVLSAEVLAGQSQWASELPAPVDVKPIRAQLPKAVASFWTKYRVKDLHRYLSSAGGPPVEAVSAELWWQRLHTALEVPERLRDTCQDQVEELLQSARELAPNAAAQRTDDGKRARPPPGSVFTPKAAAQFLERMNAFASLRRVFDIIPTSDDARLAEVLAPMVPLPSVPPSRAARESTPSWWIVGTHDVALVRGALRHGWNHLAAIAADKALPFAAMNAGQAADGEDAAADDSDGEGEGGASGVLKPQRAIKKRLTACASACATLEIPQDKRYR